MPSLVSHVKASSTGSSVTTGAIDTTGATLLVVLVSAYQHAPGTVSDSKSNIWQTLTRRNGTNADIQLYYAYNPTVGSGHTFSVSGSSYPSLFAAAFDGTVTTSAVFDQESGAGKTDNTHSTPGSITPAGSGELFITGAGAANSNSLSFAASGGFTPNIDEQDLGSTYTGGALAYLVNTGSGAENPTWTVTNGDGPSSAMACFKSSAVGAALAASITAGATVAAAFTTVIRFAASIHPVASVAAALTTAIRFAASIHPVATVAGTLSTMARFAASILGTATVAADLTTKRARQGHKRRIVHKFITMSRGW